MFSEGLIPLGRPSVSSKGFVSKRCTRSFKIWAHVPDRGYRCGNSPFQVDETIRAICFSKGEIPPTRAWRRPLLRDERKIRSAEASSRQFRQGLAPASLGLGIVFLDVRHRQPFRDQSARVGGLPHLGISLTQFDIMHETVGIDFNRFLKA
jgi:hypothetical protein